MKWLQRARRLLLVFGLMLVLPLFLRQIGVTSVWLVWVSMIGMRGLIFAAVFAIIVQIALSARRIVS
jgi:hypothetical protein